MMTINALKKSFIAVLITLPAMAYAISAHAGPELRASSTEVMVGETIQINALSGSSLIPVYAKDWNVSPEFDLISSNRTGARIQAVSPGFGTISAKVNLKNLTLTLKIVGVTEEVTALTAEPTVKPVTPVQPPIAIIPPEPASEPTATQPTSTQPTSTQPTTTQPTSTQPTAAVTPTAAAESPAKLSACELEMTHHKNQIAQDFSAGRYDQARAKLLELKKDWQEDNRWADALLGAIEQLSPTAR
jgi:hypothetical protein